MTLDIRRDVPLAPYTTLEIGGAARFFLVATDEATLTAGIRWARERDVAVYVLGSGSNVVVGDAGVDGLVLRLSTHGVDRGALGESHGQVTAEAGTPWDDLVAGAVSHGLAGLECLSGIPGTVGAAPVQNVGAYGQEASDTIISVRCLDLHTLQTLELPSAGCGFGYRDSLFRRKPGRYVVLAVTFGLRPGGAPTVSYPELATILHDEHPDLQRVRDAVLAMRRRKSMLLESDDENRRSVGSFFTNPVLAPAEADRVAARVERAAPPDGSLLPRYPTADGRVKLSAAWLIERAGFGRGLRRGRVGISTRHTLALVNRGGASAAELLALAAEVRAGVSTRFGVELGMEPICMGCTPPW